MFVISPDSVSSRECAEELRRATDLGKRLVPVLYRNAPGVPEPLTSVQYIDAEDGADFDRSVKQVDEAIQTDYDWVHAHTAWLARALRWEEGGRDRSLLLRGSELDAAEQWLARQVEGKKPPPTQLQTDYIVAGRHAQRSRLRTTVALTLVALAVSVALGVVALISRNEAIDQRDQARSRELAASAVAQLEVDPERSMLLALEAEKIANSGPADDALRRALVSSHVRAVMPGHTRSIASLDVSQDGKRVLTASRDHTARIFDTESGRPRQVLRGHRGPVAGASFSPDGRSVVTASDDGTARIWDAGSDETLAVLHHDRGAVNSAAFSRDGRRIVTAGEDGTARVWEADDGRQVAVLGNHRKGIAGASFDPSGRRVLTAGDDRTARMWNVRSGAGTVIARHERRLFLAKLSPDGRLALTLDFGGTVRVSESDSGRTVTTLEGTALGAAFSPNADSIVTGTLDGPAAVWDTRTGGRVAQLVGHGASVRSVAFSPDGRLVVTGGADDTVRIWDADRGTTVAVLKGQRAGVAEVAFTPDGQSVISGADDGSVRRWDVGAGVVLRGHAAPRAPLRGTLGQLSSINSAEASPDGRMVVTAANDGTARLWDIRSGREIIRPQDCGFSVGFEYSCLTIGLVSSTVKAVNGAGFLQAAAFSPDGRDVATAGPSGAAFVLDAKSGDQRVSLEGHEKRVFDIAYSRKGDRLVTAGEDDTARVWDASSGRELAVLRGHSKDVYAAAFTPDGRSVATASEDGTVRLWNADGGRPRRTFRLKTGIIDVAVSPDGRYLAAPVDQEARIWEIDTGRTVARLREHDGLVFSTAFSPDGHTLVTGGQDQTARLWEVPSGRPLGVLRGHNAYLIDAQFTPDGQSVVTASDDGTARVFKCDACGSAEALMRRARDRVTRPLSASERRQFLTFAK